MKQTYDLQVVVTIIVIIIIKKIFPGVHITPQEYINYWSVHIIIIITLKNHYW